MNRFNKVSGLVLSVFAFSLFASPSARVWAAESAPKPVAVDQGVMSPEDQKKIQEALAKKSPEEVRLFSEEIQKDRAVFQQKYLAVPVGAREKVARDFSDKIRADRQKLENELKAMPDDPKEKEIKAFQEKVTAMRKELNDKLKLMSIGAKEAKLADYEKKVADERKALLEKMDKMPFDAREKMAQEFKASQDAKVRKFYGI